MPEQTNPAILRELGLSTLPANSLDEFYFTGWKDTTNYEYPGGAIGQIIKRLPDKPNYAAYCNLPGMELGVVAEGGIMNVGKARVQPDITLDEMMEILRTGLEKLKEYVTTIE